MDRVEDLKNCTQTVEADCTQMSCNHVGFLDRYDWGYICGNCGSAFVFKDQIEEEWLK